MKLFTPILLFTLFLSCKKSEYTKPYVLKKSIENFNISEFYQDFDIFKRTGIYKIHLDTLTFPFFQIRSLSDSILEVSKYTEDFKQIYHIPKEDLITYNFYDKSDGARHVYSRIFKNEILLYGYYNSYDDFLKMQDVVDSVILSDVLPIEIQRLRSDSVYVSFDGKCIETRDGMDLDTEISIKDFKKYWVNPFTAKMKMGCVNRVMYFDKNGTQNQIDFEGNQSESFNSVKKEFEYWRDYYGENYRYVYK